MDQEQIKTISTTKQVAENAMQHKSMVQVFLSTLKWFILSGVITAFFVGLGSQAFCILFCSPTPIEQAFDTLGVILILVNLIGIPILSAKKSAHSDSKKSSIQKTIGLSLLGYLIVFGLTLLWLFVSNSRVEGWKPSINEQILDWVQVTAGNIKDKKLTEINEAKYNDQSFEFVVTNTELSLVNSHDSILNITGTLSGINKLSDLGVMSQNNLVISEIAVGDKIAEGSVAKRLKIASPSLGGDELDSGLITLNYSDSQQVTVAASFPKEFAQIIKSDPNSKFKIKLELLQQSPYTYKKFNFNSIWSKEIDATPKYTGQFLKDRMHNIYYKLPEDDVIIDSNGKIGVDSYYSFDYFTVTKNPKLTVCCDAPNLIVATYTNAISAQAFLGNVVGKDDTIISKKISPPSSFQMAIVEAKTTNGNPYKVFLSTRYGDVKVYKLTGENSGLEDLYNQYLENYKRLVKFE